MIPSAWQITNVIDLDDPSLTAYRNLTDMDLRMRQEVDGGYFMAEGMLVIERAYQLGLHIDSVLTTSRWLERLSSILRDWQGDVFVVEDARELTGYRVHRGALAEVRRPPGRSVSAIAAEGGNLLVLEDLVDHTNVGLAFRSAAALGISGVVISPACADPLYRRSVKSSMGAVLALPWARSREWSADLAELASSRTLLALTPDEQAQSIDVALRDRRHRDVALLVGTEGPGITPVARSLAQAEARIPMSGGIDSLNVAAATAVACYALRMTARASDDGETP